MVKNFGAETEGADDSGVCVVVKVVVICGCNIDNSLCGTRLYNQVI